jgi:hypothetical protein
LTGQKYSALYFASVVSSGGFPFGFDASVISGVISFMVPRFGLNDWQLGLVVGALMDNRLQNYFGTTTW